LDLAAVFTRGPRKGAFEKEVSVGRFASVIAPRAFFAELGELGISAEVFFRVAAESEKKVAIRLRARVQKSGTRAREVDQVRRYVSCELLAVSGVFLEEDGVLGNEFKSTNGIDGILWRSFRVVPGDR
jgi:hypothetical protein